MAALAQRRGQGRRGRRSPSPNPAHSPEQYRLAQAVLSGEVTGPTSMDKGTAREIVEKTPHALRSKWSRKANFLGFGKSSSKTTFSSRLAKSAYDAGYRGSHGHRGDEEFERWFSRQGKAANLHASIKGKLKTEYWKGVNQEEEDAASGKKKTPQAEKKAKPTVEKSVSHPYKGKVIKEKEGKYTVLGEDWHSLKDAKEYVDIHIATGGKARVKNQRAKRNPEDTAKSLYEMFHGKPSTQETAVRETIHYHGHLAELGVLSGLKVRTPSGFDVTLEFAVPEGMEGDGSADNGKGKGKGKGKRKKSGPLTAAYKFGTGIIPGALKLGDSAVSKVVGNRRRKNPSSAPVILCSNESGNQLYLRAGDQSIPPATLTKTQMDDYVRDLMNFGEIWAIAYITAKSFDDFKRIEYVHGFGPEKYHYRLSKRKDLWDDAVPPKDTVFGSGYLPTCMYDTLNKSIGFVGGVYEIKPDSGAGSIFN
jgi:hypothetical protein